MLRCACGCHVAGDYYIPKDANVSPEVLDLLSKIFQVDPMKRITLSEIWDHAWVRKGLPPNLDVDGFNAEYVRLTGVSAFFMPTPVCGEPESTLAGPGEGCLMNVFLQTVNSMAPQWPAKASVIDWAELDSAGRLTRLWRAATQETSRSL
jgi:hypothetical protein